MKKKTALSLKSAAIYTALLTVIFAIMRFYFISTALERQSGLYKYASNAHTITTVSVLAAMAAIIAMSFLCAKKCPEALACHKPVTLVVSGLLGMLLFFSLIYNIYTVFSEKAPFGLLTLLETFFCILSAIYFFIKTGKNSSSNNTAAAVFSVFPPLYIAARLIAYFLDTTVIITSSQRHLSLLYMCAAMLFLLFDAKVLLPAPINNQPEFLNSLNTANNKIFRMYVLCTFACIFFAFSVSLTYFAATVFDIAVAEIPVLSSLTDIVIGIYAASRVSDHISAQKANETK